MGMSTYYMLTLANSTPDGPAPWPIVVDQDGEIISGRPDADAIHDFANLLTGQEPIFALHATDQLAADLFTIDGMVLVRVMEYMTDADEQTVTAAIEQLRHFERAYRKALGR